MLLYDILGYIGMTLIICSLVPQIIKTYKSKKVKDLSIYLPLILLVSSCCMIPYSISIKSYQMFFIQCAMLVNSLILLCQIYKYHEYSISTPTNLNVIV